jgi:hypothetical protein
MKLAEAVIVHARAEIGVQESPRGSNRGPRVDEYQRATWLHMRDWGPWCASFVCWVIREAMREGESLGIKYTFKRPQTAKAFDFQGWSLKQDKSTSTKLNPGRDILPGDIVIFTFSHIGFATSAPDKNGRFETIEGNTNDEGSREGYEVAARKGDQARHIGTVRCRIRFTV